MNFQQKVALGGAAALALTAIGAAPASAISIGDSVNFTWSADATPTSINFYSFGFPNLNPGANNTGFFAVTNGSGDFQNLPTFFGLTPIGTIKDIPDVSAVSSANPIVDFLDFFQADDKFDFTLTQIVFDNVARDRYILQGFFGDGANSIAGIGRILTEVDDTGVTSYAATFTAIPTPAMLPGLVAMGIAALRKRKAEAGSEA